MASVTALPPGPRDSPLRQLVRYVPHPAEFLEECCRAYGPRFTMRLAGFGTFVQLAQPAAVQELFRGDPTQLHSGEANAFLAVTVGRRSVLVLDEAAHADQRRVLVPPLHGSRMQAKVERMRRATEAALRDWPLGRAVPLEPLMRDITLRTMLDVVLGIGEEEAREVAAQRLGRDLAKLLSYARTPFAIVFANLAPHELLRRVPFLPYYRELRRIHAALDQRIERRRADHRAAPPADRAAPPADLLSELLRATRADGRPIDDGEIRDALMTILVAGHDTTAVALAWLFLQIVERDGVQQRLRAELHAVTGGAPIAADHLPRLVYLDAVVRESLRLCTVVPFVTRRLTVPLRVDGHDFPAGVHLCPCIHLVHRDPELYPEPERFRPERFLERKFGPHEWLPFGGGERLCTGMAFALTEMKVVAATLLAALELARPRDAATERVRSGVLIAPSDGVVVVAQRAAIAGAATSAASTP